VRSAPIAVAVVVLIATAPDDLRVAAVIWNPIMGAILAKVATALVLLDWDDTPGRMALTVGVAWAAVQCHTGAVFVATSVFVALVARWVQVAGLKIAWRRTLLIGIVVAVLQVPYGIHQWRDHFAESGLGAVGVSLGRIANGTEPLDWRRSAAFYVAAVDHVEAAPWHVPALPVWLLVCGIVAAIRFNRDLPLLAVTVLPQVVAVAGFAFWVGGLNDYYCFSLMPAAVMSAALAICAVWPRRVTVVAGWVVMLAALATVPSRLQEAATQGRMPQYAALVTGSLTLVHSSDRVRDITTDFPLPAESDPTFVYTSLGGQLDASAPRIAVIQQDGSVVYRPSPGGR
jgi:hypothetical protein